MYKNYDSTDKYSIYKYAQHLKGKTFNDVYDEDELLLIDSPAENEIYKQSYENRQRKGGLGEIIEERYFHYETNNDTRPDFPEANLELKVTPYKVNKNQTLSAKERLIISMISYFNIVDTNLYNSNAWEKLENMLLIYYKWDSNVKDRLDYIIDYIYLYTPNKEDLKIIENDFEIIRNKVKAGKAHELSEGDTMYLGAATKSSDSKKRTPQPFSKEDAKPRAFSLKGSYMTYLLRNYITKEAEKEDKIIKDDEIKDFEKYVISKIDKHIGRKDTDLFNEYFGEKDITSKNKHSRLAYEMLGVRTKNAEEFDKANIIVRSIRVEENNKIKESISFPNFIIKELVKEDWEDSEIYHFFSEVKFLFIIYRKRDANYYLSESKFWNMPVEDIDTILKAEWTRAQNTFIEGVELMPKETKGGVEVNNNLPEKSNTDILHVRTHANKSAYRIAGVKYGNGELGSDTDELPNGDLMTKQCFWLNNDYVLKQIVDK